jgi:adenylate cyclase
MSESLLRSYLEVAYGAKTWQVELDSEAVCTIGRANQSTVVLVDDKVSRHHAVIQRREDGEYIVADLGSRNGTSVNNKQVNAPVVLADGDHIGIGDHVLLFRSPSLVQPALDDGSDATRVAFSLRRITVMFADIFGFTELLSLDPTSVSDATVAFIRESGALLKQLGTWAQKYSGDGVMALWVHGDVGLNNDELQKMIVRGVVGISDLAGQLQQRFALPRPIQIGIGIDSGDAMLGNIGSEARSDYTALGDAVNRAFRLEAATREYQCDIALSKNLYENWRGIWPNLAFRGEYAYLKGFPERTLFYAGSFGHLREVVGAQG